MNKKITLVFVSFLLTINTVFSINNPEVNSVSNYLYSNSNTEFISVPVIDATALVSAIDEGQTALGTVTSNDNVTWSITGAGVSIDTQGVVTLDAVAVFGNSYSYEVTATATDGSGDIATTGQISVNVNEATKPVITLTGTNPQIIEVGTVYNELNATATDNVDAANTLTVTPTVNNQNTAVVGSFTVDYNVSDAAGNAATTVTRTVNVVDTTAPIITLLGDVVVILEVGSVYTDAGATASDNVNGNITANIATNISGVNPNMSVVGSYTVTYNVSDNASTPNAAAQVTRTIHVVDTTIPVITLLGNNPQVIEVEDVYSEFGALASDNYDDDVTLTKTISIDASNAISGQGIIGSYTVRYNVADDNLNIATEVVRAVNIVDTTIPVITLLNENPQIIDINTVYTELGATANDNYDGDITGNILINSSAINLNNVNCYPVTYNVSDSSGNNAVQLTRIVFVLEYRKPFAKNDTFNVSQNSNNNTFNIIANDSYGLDGPNSNHPIALSGTYTDNGGKIDLIGTTVNYTPRAGFTGVDNFSYTITDENGDGSGDASTATVTVTVGATFTVPTAVADALTVAQNSGITSINVLANDSYGSAAAHATESLTLSSGTSTQGGAVVVNAGKIDYTPLAGFAGVDTFSYTIKDINNVTSSTTVTVTVDATIAAIRRPTAKADAFTVNQNSTSNILNVLADNSSGADDFGTQGAANDGLTMTNGTIIGISFKGGIISVDRKGTLSTLDDEVLYSPKAGFIGTDGFYYMITDTTGDTSIAIATVTVLEIATPTAVADTAIAVEDSSAISINVLANDSFGSDGPAITGSLTLSSGTSTNNGIIAIVAGKVDYTPLAGFTGSDTFTYTITDGSGDFSTATVTVTVSAAGSGNTPAAKNDAVSVNQDSLNNVINILNDNGLGADSYGTDGPSVSHPIALSGTYTDNGGKIDLAGTTVNYTPRTGYSGTDSFKYTITDLNGDASTATVTVTVGATFTVPTAVADALTVAQNSGITSINVLANDSYGSAAAHATESLTLSSGTSTQGGAVVVNAGKIDYTPLAGFAGVDTFSYTIKDINNVTSSTTVTVTVDATIAAIRRPTAKADAFTVSQNSTSNSLNVLADNSSGADDFGTQGAANDGLTMTNGTIIGVSFAGGVISVDRKGTLSALDDEVLYSPKAGFIGTDGFYYMITDAIGDTSIAIATVTVLEIATPTAVADTAIAVEDSSAISINVLANDSFGSDGPAITGSLTLSSGTSTNNGTIAIVAGKVDYTPLAGFTGSDTFTYTITDGSGDFSTATVTVTVSAAGSGNTPAAKNDAVTVLRNSLNNVINILDDNGSGADSYGVDGPSISHPIALSGTYTDNGGKIDLVGTTVKYTPRTAFIGTDSFNYTITDLNGDASIATVTVTVALTIPKNETSNTFGESIIKDNKFLVYPNPSNGYIKSTLFSTISTKANLYLFDITGKVVYNSSLEVEKGMNEFELNLNLKAGIVFLKIVSSEINFGTSKVIIK